MSDVNVPFPSPTLPHDSRRGVLAEYLDYFRSTFLEKLAGLSAEELNSSRLPSGWTPLQLLKHLTYVERRWLVWGFEGQPVDDPWGDERAGHWWVSPEEDLTTLRTAFDAQVEASRAVVAAHQLEDVGQPGERWDGAPPATLERVLLHLLQEYARHVGHLDIVREMADGSTGE